MIKGSLCTGIGGLDAATPGELRWVAETNPAAARVLKREFPGVENIGDITTPGLHPPTVDIVTSGDPCQSMSAAGRQMASQDERFLWPDVMRVIERVRPDEVFLENVQNLVSVPLLKGADDWRGQRGSVLALRLDDLWRAGYACRWTVLGACAVGAPHHRHRWFLRGRYVGLGAPTAVRVGDKAICGAPKSGFGAVLPTPTTRDVKGRNQRDDATCLTGAINLLPTPRATDIGTAGRRSSEGWRPQLGQVVHSLLPTPLATDGVNGGLNQRGSKGELSMGSAVQEEHWGKFAHAVATWEAVIGRPAPCPTVPAPRGGRRLNPELSEWMMGYPLGYLTGELERNEALRCAGNGVVPQQGRAAWDLLE